MTRLPVAVVGVGHLGKEHARILSSMPDVDLVAVVDPNRSQAESVALRCNTRACADYRDILPAVKAAVIAAPTCYHHAVARDFLGQGIALLIEKPLASTTDQARDLVKQATAHQALLQVGHIERFNPAFEELQTLPLTPRYITCERYSGFSGRSTDVGVVLDVMIHDLDLVLTLVDSPILGVEAMGVTVLGGHEDMVQARVRFASGCIADFTASRVHPEAQRRMRIWGAEGLASIDFARRQLNLIQPSEHLRQGRIDSRRLDAATAASLKTELFGRHLHTAAVDCGNRHERDQLSRELDDFIHCVRENATPRVTGQNGAAALDLADQILVSLQHHAWEGSPKGPAGPRHLPAPAGWLFPLAGQGIQEAA